MDVELLQQILNGLQQNNADLTAMVNSQTHQFNQQLATLQVSQSASTTNRERGKIARPEPFDGSAEKIDIFLRELYLNFEDEASYFQVDHMRKIRFALSYMKEKFAAQWASRITGELEVGARSYQSWEEFRMELLATFHDPNKKEMAQRRLEQLKQGGKPAAEFFVEFEEHRSQAGYNDEGYVALLKKNLSPQVVERIYALEAIPTTYDQWKSYALRFDSHLREYQAMRKGTIEPKVWQTPRSQKMAYAPQDQTVPQPFTPPSTRGPQPMEVDQTRGKPVRMVTCFNCREQGHIARNCPKPRGMQKVRATIDGWTKEERKEMLEMLKKEDFQEGQE